MNIFLKLLGVVVLLIIVFVGYRMFLAPDIYIMIGDSMFPTYMNGDKLAINYDTSAIERGSVVAYSFTTPSGRDSELIKRVIGLPGETIEIKEGQIFANGTVIQAPPITLVQAFKTTEPDNSEPVKLENNQYYVLGDNTSESSDSRFTGPINSSQIKAVVIGKY